MLRTYALKIHANLGFSPRAEFYYCVFPLTVVKPYSGLYEDLFLGTTW